VLDGVRILPQLVIALVVGGAGGVLTLPFLVGGGAVLVGLRYLSWLRTTYRIEDGALVVERGLLDRTRTVVPLDRIQQVDLQRKLRHQITGLAVLRIDRAGGGKEAEVVLDAVTTAEAERLRAVVAGTAAPSPREGPRPEQTGDREVLALGLREVALAGVTGTRLLVVFAAVGAVFGGIGDIAGQDAAFAAVRDWVEDGRRPAGALLVVLVLVALPLWLAVAAGSSVLADGGFRLTRRGDQLRVTRGVLDQREASLAIHRVQVVWVRDNPLRRALGRVTVSLQSAGGAGSVEGASTTVTVPLLRRDAVDALLAEVLPGAPALPALVPAPPAARRRAWVRHVVPAGLIAGPVAALAAPLGLLALLLPVAAVALGEAAYRGLGWTVRDGVVAARSGGLGRRLAIVPIAKAQSTRLRSSPFQRRAGLATLLVDVAGRGRTPAVVDGPASHLAPLRHDALQTSAARHDEAIVRRRARA
jgi:putative membrane protein